MFITYTRNFVRSLDRETNVWNQVEVLGHVPLLLIEAPAPRDDPEVTALYLSVPMDLKALQDQADFGIRSVKLLSPRYLNKSRSWKLEELIELWTCDEPEAWVFVLESSRYVFSLRDTPERDLTKVACVYKKTEESQT